MENTSIDQLLGQMKAELGAEPRIMKLLSRLKPEGVVEHAKEKAFAMGSESIPQKYKLLMAIAVSAAIGSSGCVRNYSTVASNKGVSNDEIIDSLLLARFVSAAAVVNTAGEAMEHLLASKAMD